MASVIGTFILDFQTIDFEVDSKIAIDLLAKYQKTCNINDYKDHNSFFALDTPVSSAGWSFAKLFLAGRFVEKLYELNLNEINDSKGKNFEDKFVYWLGIKLRNNKCEAKLKVASEMK